MINPDSVVVDAERVRAHASFALDEDADFLVDHFPGAPMLPGLLMLELAVRTAAAVVEARDGSECAVDVSALERFHVLRRVVPGEVLELETELDEASLGCEGLRFRAAASVDGAPAMRAAFRVVSIPAPCGARADAGPGGYTTQ
jgi:3-hydroxyacyl-[acyl-carrier-protein] dehydratase